MDIYLKKNDPTVFFLYLLFIIKLGHKKKIYEFKFALTYLWNILFQHLYIYVDMYLNEIKREMG